MKIVLSSGASFNLYLLETFQVYLSMSHSCEGELLKCCPKSILF